MIQAPLEVIQQQIHDVLDVLLPIGLSLYRGSDVVNHWGGVVLEMADWANEAHSRPFAEAHLATYAARREDAGLKWAFLHTRCAFGGWEPMRGCCQQCAAPTSSFCSACIRPMSCLCDICHDEGLTCLQCAAILQEFDMGYMNDDDEDEEEEAKEEDEAKDQRNDEAAMDAADKESRTDKKTP